MSMARKSVPTHGTHGEGSRISVHGPDQADRGEVEAFIRGVFADRYGARVGSFAPHLVALRCNGQIEAAAGYRPATTPLFLERYLDAPVDQMLAPHAGTQPTREQIVEVGHLAATRAGMGRRLILGLGLHLAESPCQWVVSTLTEELRHLFVRMGVTPLALGIADPARLGADSADWGRYYEHHPIVLAGQLRPALRRLQARGASA